MQAHARKVPISHDVDFDHLADATEGFSGADLQALLYNAHLEVVHENIGGGQISVSTLPATATGSSGSSKDHLVDDTSIEYTSFGGPAQNNDAVKSRAEQMSAHRRVRIKPLLRKTQSSETQLLGPATLFAARFLFSLFFFGSCARSWLLHSVVVVREQILRMSWSTRIVQRYIYVCVEASCLLPKPQNSN